MRPTTLSSILTRFTEVMKTLLNGRRRWSSYERPSRVPHRIRSVGLDGAADECVRRIRRRRSSSDRAGFLFGPGIELPGAGKRRRDRPGRQRRHSDRCSAHGRGHIRCVLTHLPASRVHRGDQRFILSVPVSRSDVRIERSVDWWTANVRSRGVFHELRFDDGHADDHELTKPLVNCPRFTITELGE